MANPGTNHCTHPPRRIRTLLIVVEADSAAARCRVDQHTTEAACVGVAAAAIPR